MPIFPLLSHPEQYRACETDLLLDAAAREHWLDVYSSHTRTQLAAAATVGVSEYDRSEALDEWLATLQRVREQPDRYGRLDILRLDELRQTVLHAHGIVDEYQLLKERENDLALAGLRERLAQLDAITDDDHRLAELFRGMLAGNLFDMGVAATAKHFEQGRLPFNDALALVPARPWHVDHVEQAAQLLRDRFPSRVLMFADNAGADAVLGLLPLARELVNRGGEVIIAANEKPAINDITRDEFRGVLERAAGIDDTFASPSVQLVSSGNAAPLIDLLQVSDELVAASRDVSLIILIGMGRSVESNYSATFTVASWKIAMLKDAQVAGSVGGNVFDAVMKMQP